MKLIAASGLALLASGLPIIASEPATAPPAPAHPDRLGYEISISPGPPCEDPGSKPHYLVTAIVRQLETDGVLFAARVYALEGIPASVTSDREDGVRFKATFLIDGSAAKYTLEETQRDERLAVSAGTIQLAR